MGFFGKLANIASGGMLGMAKGIAQGDPRAIATGGMMGRPQQPQGPPQGWQQPPQGGMPPWRGFTPWGGFNPGGEMPWMRGPMQQQPPQPGQMQGGPAPLAGNIASAMTPMAGMMMNNFAPQRTAQQAVQPQAPQMTAQQAVQPQAQPFDYEAAKAQYGAQRAKEMQQQGG